MRVGDHDMHRSPLDRLSVALNTTAAGTRHITASSCAISTAAATPTECLTSQTLWPGTLTTPRRIVSTTPGQKQPKALPSGPPHEQHRGRLFTWLYQANIASRRRPRGVWVEMNIALHCTRRPRVRRDTSSACFSVG